jgi:hypothetical protein
MWPAKGVGLEAIPSGDVVAEKFGEATLLAGRVLVP